LSELANRRPILNLRDESHARDDLARMHIIYFDNVLSPVANFLKAGTTQLVLALAEAGWADPALLLNDPLAACQEVSRDLTLKKPLLKSCAALASTSFSWTGTTCAFGSRRIVSGGRKRGCGCRARPGSIARGASRS
jgi:hypothetical protein